MNSVTTGSGERPVRPDSEQYALREALWQHYHADRYFQNIREWELRPLYRKLGRSLPHFWDVTAAYEESGDPQIARYIAALEEVTVGKLRLIADGEAAPWALDFLHEDIASEIGPTRVPLTPEPSGPVKMVDLYYGPGYEGGERFSASATLHIELSSLAARIALTRPNNLATPTRHTVQRGRRHGEAFDEWEKLEEEATTLLREAIRALRIQHREAHQIRNAKAAEQQEEDMTALFDWLFHAVSLDKSQRDRIRPGIARKIGITIPPRLRSR